MSEANRGQTHWVGCYTEQRHHACALEEIRRLRQIITELEDRLTNDNWTAGEDL